MSLFRKSVVGLAVASLIAAPVAAAAAPSLEGARAVSASSGDESEFGGGSSWIIGLIGLLAGVVAIALVMDNDEDSPVSP